MRSTLGHLSEAARPALLVIAVLALLLGAWVGWSYLTRAHPGAPTTAPAPHATTAAAATQPLAKPGSRPDAPTPELAVGQKLREARRLLDSTPPDLEGALYLLEQAESLASEAGVPSTRPDVPTAQEVRNRIDTYRSALLAALRVAREDFSAEAVADRLAEARVAWDQPGIAECLAEIQRLVLLRISLEQSQGRPEAAVELAAELQRLAVLPELAELIGALQAAQADAGAAGRNDAQRKEILLSQARELYARHDIRGRPTPRRAPRIRDALEELAALLHEADLLAPEDAAIEARKAEVDAWLSAARAARNVQLSLAPDETDLVGLVDLERLRAWPAASSFIADWFDSPQITGLTRTVTTVFKSLGVRPLGAASLACFGARWESPGGAAAIGSAADPQFWCIVATHVHWDEALRAIADELGARDAEPRGTLPPVLGDERSLALVVGGRGRPASPASVPATSPAGHFLGLANGLWLFEESAEIIALTSWNADWPTLRGADSRPAHRDDDDSAWTLADLEQRDEDLWLAIRAVPAHWEQALGLPGLSKSRGVLLTARHTAGGVLVAGRFVLPDARAAAEFEVNLHAVLSADSPPASDPHGLRRIVATLARPARSHVEGSAACITLDVPDAQLVELFAALRAVVMPTHAEHSDRSHQGRQP